MKQLLTQIYWPRYAKELILDTIGAMSLIVMVIGVYIILALAG